ncbi:MAG: hypothetical protein Q4E24_00065 [bacterium]|nr:hypothetical protein [bacterium]
MQLETLEQFKNRVYSFEYHSLYLDSSGKFCTNSNLCHKINADGTMKPYLGNTVVFVLQKNGSESGNAESEAFLAHLAWMQDMLYSRCQDMLSDRLREDTFHMTLHDLVNGTVDGVNRHAMDVAGQEIKVLLERIRKENWILRMRTTCVFNMVNTSVVLGLEPVSEEDCSLLMRLYEQMEKIVPLGYPITPHITLAYYKPGIYNADNINSLEDTFRMISKETCTVALAAEDLVYQRFCDMNQYYEE